MGLVSLVGGTWFGGLIGHCIVVPLWTLSPVPAVIAIAMLCAGGEWLAYGAIILVLNAALLATTFPYSPGLPRLLYDLDMPRYYRKCELRGPGLRLMEKSKTLFMFHPHGILSAGFSVNGCWSKDFNALACEKDLDTQPSSNTLFLIDNTLRRWFPFFKVLCDLSGRLESATKGNMLRFMAAGRNLAIIPGGFEDATIHQMGKHRTAMKKRKGIIKYALQHGYAVTPIYTFGETNTYNTFTHFLKPRLALNKYGVPAVCFFGSWLFPLLPKSQVDLFTYVGPPLQLPKIDEPSAGDLDEWLGKYTAALTDLFDKHKAEAGHPAATLEIW
jgi:2-acylglycerol O-acyltransferase 2